MRRLRFALIATLSAAALGLAPRTIQHPLFPLRVSENHRALEDASGTPFRVTGDSAWSLIAQLGPVDVSSYLDDRAARGFNAIIVNLIEHTFASNAPADHGGVQPFQPSGSFRNPNTIYFTNAHRVVEEAERRGIAVWLCPAYLGWAGGDEGFFTEISAAGPAALREYGRFVGRRFKDLPNVVWMLGGDFAFPPTLRWLGDELAAGLREGGARQLMSAHGGQTTAVDTFGDRPWLAVDTVYSYAADPWPALLAAYGRTPTRPIVLIESVYEGEHDARPEQIRRQAWTAILSGAAGQFFGNNPVWHFDGPTLFPFTGTWREALDSDGARDITRLGSLLRARLSSALEPDRDGRLVTIPNDPRPIAAAWTVRRDVALAYFPAGSRSGSNVLVNLRGFPKPMTAHWIDPGSDAPPRDGGILKPGADGQRVTMPGDRDPTMDWVLMLERR
jgi:hypothetical protein